MAKTENLHAALDFEVILRRMNLSGIWQVQNVEQIHALSILTLSANPIVVVGADYSALSTGETFLVMASSQLGHVGC